MELRRALDVAVAAAREAAEHLQADFHRPAGPRGKIDKAPADTEAEELIRARLLAAFPDWGYLGEETGRHEGAPGAPIWLVDPNGFVVLRYAAGSDPGDLRSDLARLLRIN